MAYENIHVSDFGWQAKLVITQDGTAVDISSYTTRQFILRKPDGTEVTKTAAFETDGTDGALVYTVEEDVIDTVGRWRVRAFIAKTGAELTSARVGFDVRARE